MNDLSPTMSDHDEHVKQSKGRGEDGKEVHRGDELAIRASAALHGSVSLPIRFRRATAE
jgi:hypothetical protein